MSITHEAYLNIVPGDSPAPIIKVSQYDADFSIVFHLIAKKRGIVPAYPRSVENDEDVTINVPTSATVSVRGTKTDGNGYSANATLSGTATAPIVTVTGHEQMTASAGVNVYEITFYADDATKRLSTANFILFVEPAALDASTITSESLMLELNDLIASVPNAVAAADRAEQAVQSVEGVTTQVATNTQDISDIKADLGKIDDVFSDNAKQILLQILKKAVYLSDVESLIDNLETAILSGIITIGPRGIIEINNSKAGLPIALKLDVSPVQDLHGYEYPWAEGKGKNICKYFANFERNGITLTTESDGKVTVSGTATATVLHAVTGLSLDKECIYYMSGDSDIAGGVLSLRNSSGNTVTDNGIVFGQANVNNSPTRIYSIQDLTDMQYTIRVGSGATPTGYFLPMITKVGVNNHIKNLFTSGEKDGLTFTVSDGVVAVNGTAQNIVEYDGTLTLPKGEYVISGNRGGIFVYVYNSSKSEQIIAAGERGGQFSLDDETNVIVSIHCNAGTYSNKTAVPVICDAIEDISYAPYSNICPFTKIDSITMKHGASASSFQAEDFNVSSDNYYGGEIDFVNRKITKAAYYSSYAGESLSGEWVSSMDKYVAGSSPTIGAEVVNIGSQNELSKTVNQIPLLDGNNRLWSENGDTTLTYEKKVV